MSRPLQRRSCKYATFSSLRKMNPNPRICSGTGSFRKDGLRTGRGMIIVVKFTAWRSLSWYVLSLSRMYLFLNERIAFRYSECTLEMCAFYCSRRDSSYYGFFSYSTILIQLPSSLLSYVSVAFLASGPRYFLLAVVVSSGIIHPPFSDSDPCILSILSPPLSHCLDMAVSIKPPIVVDHRRHVDELPSPPGQNRKMR